MSKETLTPGTEVIKSGYPGVVLCEYLPGMYEVRLASGVVVVPIEELSYIRRDPKAPRGIVYVSTKAPR